MNGKQPQTIPELYFCLKGEIDKLVSRLESVQKEVTEHKQSHWKIMTAAISTTGVITSIATAVLFYLMR